MSKPIERIVKTNGISLNVVEQGQGPLFCSATASRKSRTPGAARSTRWMRRVSTSLPLTCVAMARATDPSPVAKCQCLSLGSCSVRVFVLRLEPPSVRTPLAIRSAPSSCHAD
jgi:hypothetical protein